MQSSKKLSEKDFQAACTNAIKELRSFTNPEDQLDSLTEMFVGYLEARRHEIDDDVLVEFSLLRSLFKTIRELEPNFNYR